MSTPATLPSLARWLDGSQVAYSDSGTTVAAAPYGRVAQIAQPAPLSGNWTATGSLRPWREANSLDFHAADPNELLAPTGITIPANGCTVGMSWQNRGGQQNMALFAAPLSGGGQFAMLITGGTLYIEVGATAVYGPPGLGTLVPGHNVAQCSLVVTLSPTQIEIKFTINGTTTTSTIASTQSGTIGQFRLGRWGGGGTPYGHYCLSQFVVTAVALGSSDKADLQAYLASKPADEPSLAAPQVTMIGDSVCSGWFPGFQTALNALSNPPRVLNVGAAGTGTTNPAQIPSYYTTDALPHYSASRAKNVLVCEGISINDVSALAPSIGASAAAAQVLAAYYGILDRARADGYVVVACTLSPVSSGAAYESCRQIINADILANWRAHADYLADVGNAPGMSTPADMTNPAVSVDGTHLAPGGYAIWDTILVPVLTAALTAPDPEPPIPSPAVPKFQMQGRNTATQGLVTWLSDTADWTGASAPVSVADVAIYVRSRTRS